MCAGRSFGLLALSVWLASLTGCDGGPGASPLTDSGADRPDGALVDGAGLDAGPPLDAGPFDAGALDSGSPDAGPPPPNEPATADTVVDAPGASDAPFHDPARAVNGVRGGGVRTGGLDVFSIDYGSFLVISWGGRRVRNGPGVDLAVFENAFEFGAGSVFMDQVIVELSIDGATWVALPFDYVAPDERAYSNDSAHWQGFGGVTPVLLHADDNAVDPFDHELAGGDHFDLDALGVEGEAGRIRREGFVFLRLTPAADRVNPDTGEGFVRDPVGNGPDIDGVHARYVDMP